MAYTRNTFLSLGFGQRYPWLDVVNSMQWDGHGNVMDHLEDESWVRAFLARWDLQAWTTTMGSTTQELRKSRTLLRSLVTSWSASRVLTGDDLRAVNAVLGVPVRQTFFRDSRGWHLATCPLRTSAEWIGTSALESFARAFTDDDPRRIKICPNGGCRWVFFDETTRNIRKWCRDAACGNRDRVRRSRLRLRS